jgi:Zn-dependent alcohol dehydrogenase
MDMQAKGDFPLEKLITRYHVRDFARAIQDMKSGKTIKPVLTWD